MKKGEIIKLQMDQKQRNHIGVKTIKLLKVKCKNSAERRINQ